MNSTNAKQVHTISRIAIGKAQADLEETPTDPFLPPQASGYNYGESLWGKTAKIVVQLPTGQTDNYFLKVWFLAEKRLENEY